MPHGVHISSRALAVRLPKETAKRIKDRAAARGVSVNFHLREFIDQHIGALTDDTISWETQKRWIEHDFCARHGHGPVEAVEATLGDHHGQPAFMVSARCGRCAYRYPLWHWSSGAVTFVGKDDGPWAGALEPHPDIPGRHRFKVP